MPAKLFERVLLTNDDGIASEGILALERAANLIAEEVCIIAPEHDSLSLLRQCFAHDHELPNKAVEN